MSYSSSAGNASVAAVPVSPAKTPGRILFIRWLRTAHGWIGLWGAALGLLFGVSGIVMNHRAVLKLPLAQPQESNVQLPLPQAAPANAQAMAEWLRSELKLDHPSIRAREEPAHGVAWGDRAMTQPAHWQISLSTARINVQADWWVGNGFISVKRSDNTFFGVLSNLHKGVGMGVPWILLVDTLGGSIILLSLTGVVLWTQLSRRRVIGTILAFSSLSLVLMLALWAM